MDKLFGLKFYDKDIDELVKVLNNKIEENKKVSVFTPNVDHIINNEKDIKVKESYVKSEFIIADGWPLVAVSKLKKINVTRITGVDLMDELLKLADENRYDVFFLGSTTETLDKLHKNITNRFPNIAHVGCNNGYFNDDNHVIRKINSTRNNILFVGMGNPKQEIWIRKNYSKLNSNIMIGVGGAFNIFSEDVERAPKWIQSIGMEWFYRFTKEPKRLFHRYFLKYPLFIKCIYKEMRN